jgi:UDPglucose 6-dehydrogenase|tara:strand:+ start:2898 stop:4223 length:1326 start_codon:yes stop_codon:yes gene_type:complete
MNLSILGCGYVGLVTGACFADLGNKVTCYDISKKRVNSLKKSSVPFYEPGLDGLVADKCAQGHLSFTNSLSKCLDFSDIYFICVGTPQRPNGKPNLEYLNSAITSIIAHVKKNNNLESRKHIFIKSTIPPGTIKKLLQKLKKGKLDKYISISSNPEFLKEGSAIQDFMKPDRVIVGSNDSDAIEISRLLHRPILWKSDRLLLVTPESSETIKYASNAFLAMKISFINEVAKLSDAIGADINEIRRGIGMDERINPNFLYSGIGYGGSCFPKDVQGLSYVYQKNNIIPHLVNATINVNNQQIEHFLNKIFSVYSKNDLKTKSFAVWGQAFKPNTDDIRESVGIKLIKRLSPLVKEIKIFEPIAKKNSQAEHQNLSNVMFASNLSSSVKNVDSLIICTECKEFWNIDLSIFTKLADKNIFDGRNILDKDLLTDAGINYFGVGR